MKDEEEIKANTSYPATTIANNLVTNTNNNTTINNYISINFDEATTINMNGTNVPMQRKQKL